MFVKHYAHDRNNTAHDRNKVRKAIFSTKVSQGLQSWVSSLRALLVEYAYHIWSLYLLRFKSDGEG